MWHNPIARQFAGAILNPSWPKPASVTGPHGKAVDKRFNVYRNNVAYSLVEALGKNHPAVKTQCGDAKFNDAAMLYFCEHPPRTKMMFELGKSSEQTTGFADWLGQFAPAKAQMPWLADLARTERSWLDAYHAEDASPLNPSILGTIAPDAFGDLRFLKHPATFTIRSPFSVFTLLEKALAGQTDNDPFEPQNVLITRPQLDVELRRLPAGAAAFMAELFNGVCLAEAAEVASQSDLEFDLAAALGLLLQSGATTALL